MTFERLVQDWIGIVGNEKTPTADPQVAVQDADLIVKTDGLRRCRLRIWLLRCDTDTVATGTHPIDLYWKARNELFEMVKAKEITSGEAYYYMTEWLLGQ